MKRNNGDMLYMSENDLYDSLSSEDGELGARTIFYAPYDYGIFPLVDDSIVEQGEIKEVLLMKSSGRHSLSNFYNNITQMVINDGEF